MSVGMDPISVPLRGEEPPRGATDRTRTDGRTLAERIFEDLPVPIMVTGPTAVIVGVNRAFTRVTGYTAEEVVGRNPRLLASGRHRREFYQEMWEALVVDGFWEGEIWNRRKNGEIYPEFLCIAATRDERGAVTHYIATFRDVSTRKAREDRLQHLSQHDLLTDLPNRALLRDRLEHAIGGARRSDRQFAVLFVDLDKFKAVNDSAGHQGGDQVLQEAALRLTHVVREVDTVARIGGDEFAILMVDSEGRTHIEALAGRVLDQFSRPFEVSGGSYMLRCSIGISVGPAPGDDPDHFIERADRAMYRAKRSGGGRYVFAE